MAAHSSSATLRRRILMTHASLAIVVVIGALTALIALHSTSRRSAQTRRAEESLAALDELRAGTAEVARSARRFVLGGNGNDRMRVAALVQEVEQQATRGSLGRNAVLMRELHAYNETLTNLMDGDTAGPLEHLERFERELTLSRGALDDVIDEVSGGLRAKRHASPSASVLARRAQWTIGFATVLVLLLVLVAATTMLYAVRRNASPGATPKEPADPLPTEPTTLT